MLRSKLCFLGVLALASNGCLGGCGSEGLPSGGLDGGPTADARLGPRPAACPAASPAQGGACAQDGLLCEYGDDLNPLCNQVSVCSSGKWASPIFPGASASCPSAGPSVGPNPADCAGARLDVPEGQACSTTSSCAYAGSLCSCGVFCRSFPLPQPDCNPDAGVTQSCCDTSKVQWHCFDGPPSCASPRPRIGTACTTSGATCAVEPPRECGQTQLECSGGLWTIGLNSCPISSARWKRDIDYLAPDEAERLHEQLMGVRLAQYRYKSGDDSPHLGFIIEDMPAGSPAVLASRDRVDLYGFVSMAVASLQQQQKEIAALKAEVARLAAANAHPADRSKPRR